MSTRSTLSRTESLYGSALSKIAKYVFDHHPYATIGIFAANAYLSPGTLVRLRDGKTKSPHFRSIYKMCLAAGVTWTVDNKGAVHCEVIKITRRHLKRARAA